MVAKFYLHVSSVDLIPVWPDGLHKKAPNIFQKTLNLEPNVKTLKRWKKLLIWTNLKIHKNKILKFFKLFGKFFEFLKIILQIFWNFYQIYMNLFMKSNKKWQK